MKYSVRHQTKYLYTEPVSISYNRVHSQPCSSPFQSFSRARLSIDPEPAFSNYQPDFFGNPVTFFTVQKSHRELEVTVQFEAEVNLPQWQGESTAWERAAAELKSPGNDDCLAASQFRFDSTWIRRSGKLKEFALPSFPSGASVLEGAMDLSRRIYRDFEFDPTATTVATPLEEVLEERKGVCQDFAHLAVGALRSLGLAARYVSGYILTMPPPGKPRLQGADASHAWLSVWCPPLGWVDIDPTNDLKVTDQHITLAWGRDYHDVCPLRGVVLGGGTQTVKVGVDVLPLEPEPVI